MNHDHDQAVTADGVPDVRTRPAVPPEEPSAVTSSAGVGGGQRPAPASTATGAESGKAAPVAAPYRCRWMPHCEVYSAIRVEVPNHGACRVMFHGELVSVCSVWNAALVVQGLHAGAHLEARQWRWTGHE